jgi:hypothetical protein
MKEERKGSSFFGYLITENFYLGHKLARELFGCKYGQIRCLYEPFGLCGGHIPNSNLI